MPFDAVAQLQIQVPEMTKSVSNLKWGLKFTQLRLLLGVGRTNGLSA